MVKGAVTKVMWVGKATMFLVGLAVVVGLTVGLGSAALAGTGVGATFNLGDTNAVNNAVSRLVGSVAGPSLQINNNSEDPKATALRLNVKPGHAPLQVNSTRKVVNLNADRIDGQDAATLKPLVASVTQTGTLDPGANSRGVESVRKVKTGIYEVTFDREVSACPRLADTEAILNGFSNIDFIGSTGQEGEADTFNVIGGDEKIGVLTSTIDGTRADKAFQLAVMC